MKIRKATKADWVAVNAMARQVHELHVGFRPDLYVSQDEVISKEQYEKWLDSGGVFVGELEGKVMAYACCLIRVVDHPIMHQGKVLFVDALGVDEKFRGCGAGKQMMEWIMDYGRQQDCDRVELQVNGRNKSAIEFYEGVGMIEKAKVMEVDLKNNGGL